VLILWWSGIEVEKAIGDEKWDWSRESDQRWQVGGWLLACYPLTIVFPGRQLTNLPHCFWVFRLSGVEGWRVFNVLATYQPSSPIHAFGKKQYSRTRQFLIKKLHFLIVIYLSFQSQTTVFSILQTNPTISRTIFSHHLPHCHHDSLPGIKSIPIFIPGFRPSPSESLLSIFNATAIQFLLCTLASFFCIRYRSSTHLQVGSVPKQYKHFAFSVGKSQLATVIRQAHQIVTITQFEHHSQQESTTGQ